LNQYHLVLEALPDFQKDPAKLNEIYVKSSSGGAVPLSAFTHFESGTAPLAINRQGQFPSVTISFNLAPERHWARRRQQLNARSRNLKCR